VRTLFLALGTVLLGVLLWRLGPLEVLHLVLRIGWRAVPFFLCFSMYQAIRAQALRLCTGRPEALGYRDALAIRCSGEAVQALSFTGPVLAEPTKAWLLTHRGLTLQEGFAATITEYLICTFVTAVIAIPGLLYLAESPGAGTAVARGAVVFAAGMAVFLVVSGIAIARRFYLIGTIVAALAKVGVLRGRLRPDIEWVNRMEDLLLGILREHPARFAHVALLELMAQGFLVLEAVVALGALAPTVSVLEAFAIEGSSKFATFAFAFIPMQMGASEGTYAVIFRALGVASAAGVALALVRRARTLVFAGIGLAALARRRTR
jgi:hypothetical protein